jgi:hypothetical protein
MRVVQVAERKTREDKFADVVGLIMPLFSEGIVP